MNLYTKPRSKLIQQGDDMYTILDVVSRNQFVDE